MLPSCDKRLAGEPYLRSKGQVQRLGYIAAQGADDLIAILGGCNDGADYHDVLIVQLDVPVLRACARAARGAPTGRLGQPCDQLARIRPQHTLQMQEQTSHACDIPLPSLVLETLPVSSIDMLLCCN